ncbi:translation initiation factor [Namhaeicola litoreus]|uniref:Translation initiation factor n=1 Tax=Namhaeicola litoreus TaxID=1052145 RepID=A0ABW3Y3Y4_9FLAO
MGKKKLNSLEDLGGFVFSTNKELNYNDDDQDLIETLPPSEQLLEAHFSNKNRAGKTVTIIKGFVGKEEDLKDLAKLIKTKCSVGGTIKEGEIMIQGNFREKVMEILKKEGYKVKRVGG